jgi:hypothetical protein
MSWIFRKFQASGQGSVDWQGVAKLALHLIPGGFNGLMPGCGQWKISLPTFPVAQASRPGSAG